MVLMLEKLELPGNNYVKNNLNTAIWYKSKRYALQIDRKVSYTLGKVSDIGNKLLPLAETVGTALGFGPEV